MTGLANTGELDLTWDFPIEFVTSVSKAYFAKYGIELLKSVLRYGPARSGVRIYCDASGEGCSLGEYVLPVGCEGRVRRLDLFSETRISAYLKRARPIVEGRIGPVSLDPDERRRSPQYDYRWDALTFARKGFSLAHSLLSTRADYTFWVDSDLVLIKDMSSTLLQKLFQGGAMVVFFGRRDAHTETGFVGFRSSMRQIQEFARLYLDYWESGKVFSLSEGWTDCDVFDAVLHPLVMHGKIRAKNLSRFPRGHVIATSTMGAYLHHRKGGRKGMEISPTWERPLEIWREMFKFSLDGLGILESTKALAAKIRKNRFRTRSSG